MFSKELNPPKNTILLTIFLSALLSLSSNDIYSQELSDAFLEGLPENVKQTLTDKNKQGEEATIDKLFNSTTSLDKNKELLALIRNQLDGLEAEMNPEKFSDDELQRFGESFFSSYQSSFMPINMPNIGSDYVVDVGDIFFLQLNGKINDGLELEIQRDGSLILPDIGQIHVAGKSLRQVEADVTDLIKTTSLGVTHYLSLSKLRDVQIILLGGVFKPGIYTISGGSNILSAINAAGGISEKGSFRKIELRRSGKIIHTLDLYDIFVSGEFDSRLTLRSGDSLFIAPISLQIPVTGGVNNSALFEGVEGDSIADMIEYAGGFSDSFNGFKNVLLRRVDTNSTKLLEVPLEKINNVTISARDSILVPSFQNTFNSIMTVEINGAVKRPGKYYFLEGETLSSVIARAGGYKDTAYTFGGALFRKDAINLETIFDENAIEETINSAVDRLFSPDVQISSSTLEILLSELRAKKNTGRIVTNFDQDFLAENPDRDILLFDNDKIIIPELQKVVYLLGAFQNSSNLPYEPGFSAEDYVDLAGGIKKSSGNELLVIDPDGNTHIYSAKKGLAFARNSADIYPGSIIYAPRDLGELRGVRYVSTISPIISSLALSLASLNSINN